MINRLRLSLFRAVVAGLISAVGFAPASATNVCKDFELLDSRGRSYSLSEATTSLKVVAFLGTECPLVKLYSQRLNALAREFNGQVTFFGLNANCQDSNSEIANFSRQFDLQFPLLKDLRNQVADQLGARRTPEVFLLDQQNRVRYQGRIDDQYGVGYARPQPTKSELRDAIQFLLNGKTIPIAKTEAVGCLIGRQPRAKPNRKSGIQYDSHIVPLLEKHCIECHRDDEIAPFSLDSYDEVIGWGETIQEVVEQRRMPPWHAHPEFGEFKNTRGLSEEEKKLIAGWVDAGMPRGESGREPVPISRPGGWQLPQEPDLVLSINSDGFTVPAEGTVEYQYFVVDPKLEEDRWISAAQVRPGNRSVVHHVIVFVRPPDGERQTGLGWLTGYVPGQSNLTLPDGFARRIPAGSKLVFQMHYTPIGSKAIDKTEVGLVFRDEQQVHTEVQTRLVIDRDFEIPPLAKDFTVEMQSTNFAAGSKLLGIAPHMHYRGSGFHVNLTASSSLVESSSLQIEGATTVSEKLKSATNTLLYVPNYDFNWQHLYLLKKPIALLGKTLCCTAVFDNSESNPVNPDPSASVRWGDQTWEEMAMAYLLISIPRDRETVTPTTIVSEGGNADTSNSPQQREQRAQELTDQFFARLDTNHDDEILRSETPKSFRAFAWRLYDRNQDDKLTRDEVLQRARISTQP